MSSTLSLSIDDYTFKVVGNVTYLSSTIPSNLSLDAEMNMQTGRAETAMALLAKRVNTKMNVYLAHCLKEQDMDPLILQSQARPYPKQDHPWPSRHSKYVRSALAWPWLDRCKMAERYLYSAFLVF